jgi:hypothetical protein
MVSTDPSAYIHRCVVTLNVGQLAEAIKCRGVPMLTNGYPFRAEWPRATTSPLADAYQGRKINYRLCYGVLGDRPPMAKLN